ncbi:MAG: glycosyltransferase family 9 protein [Bacteroidales bacterium]
MNSFLIIQTASIGDVILATPILEKLHHHFPLAKIDFLVKKGNESLFYGHPFLHQVLIWDKSSNKYSNFAKLNNYIRYKKYDCVINVQRFASSSLMTVFSGSSLTIGFNKNPFSMLFQKRVKHTIKKGNRHEIERNLDLVRTITDPSSFPVKLYPGQKDMARMSQFKTAQYITVSPASLWFTKQYPEEKWIDFISKTDPGLQIYFLGSKTDHLLCDRIINHSGHKFSLNLSGKLNLLESAALMKDATMNFVNDSAPMHLASSVNAATTAIFCSTVTSFGFGPLSDKSVVVETRLKLACRPCGLHGFKKCPKKHFNCAWQIDTNDLLKQLN